MTDLALVDGIGMRVVAVAGVLIVADRCGSQSFRRTAVVIGPTRGVTGNQVSSEATPM